MFGHLKSHGYFRIPQAICNQAYNIFFTARQQWHSVRIIEAKRFEEGKSAHNMPKIVIAGPVLSPMDCSNAFRKSF
jgi:hypothetical protein